MDKNLHILLVDDDEDEYVLLKGVFGRLPGLSSGVRHQLDWVATYNEALTACQRENYDIHLIDYHLGEHNGLDLIREAAERGARAPFILLTGQGSYELDLAAMELGVYDYLLKDQINEYVLERSLRYALERRQIEEDLEQRVQRRTTQLAEINQELKNEMARRALAEQTLRESEARFRALAETTSAAIFIVQDRKIRYANPATRFVTGYSPDDLLGSELYQLIHPAYQAPFKNPRAVSQWAENIPARYEIKLFTREGEERWVDVTVGSMEVEGGPAWLYTAFDITERDRAENSLRESEAALRSSESTLRASEAQLRRAKEGLELRVIERTAVIQATSQRLQIVLRTMPVAVAIADENGRVVEGNQAFRELWELEGDLPQTWDDWAALQSWWAESGLPVALEDRPLTRAVMKGEGLVGQVMDIQTRSDRHRTVITSAVPIFGPEGRISGGVAVSQDITHQRQLEQQAQAAAREAQQRADELDGLARATAALLSTLELDELLCQILDAAQSAIPAAEKGHLHLISPGTGQLQVRATLGFSDERIRIIRALKGTEIPARVARERRPMMVSDIEVEGLPEGTLICNPCEMSDLDGDLGEIRSMILAPLAVGEQVLGTLSLISAQPGAFTASNLRLLSSFAATTTAAMQNAILHAEIKQLAVTDPLTGQYNRRAFFDIGQREIERFLRFNYPLSALMIDLDNFKGINDTYGHAAGDQILRTLALRVRETIRDTDIFGRYGGDEFALLLPDTDLPAALHIAGRIREAVTLVPWVTDRGDVPVSVSLGVAQINNSHKVLEDLLADADAALYIAKTHGRDRVEVHQSEKDYSDRGV